MVKDSELNGREHCPNLISVLSRYAVEFLTGIPPQSIREEQEVGVVLYK
jgi:hypothetical protein